MLKLYAVKHLKETLFLFLSLNSILGSFHIKKNPLCQLKEENIETLLIVNELNIQLCNIIYLSFNLIGFMSLKFYTFKELCACPY